MIINYCSKVADNGIVAIANSCFELENISLSEMAKLTNISFMSISKNCKKLKILNISLYTWSSI
jgi:hypothetical protein